jgi:hypothetical protein
MDMKTNLNIGSRTVAVGGSGRAQSTPPQPSRISPLLSPLSSLPSYSLSNTAGFWELTFSGRYTCVPQTQALFYLSCLLANPYGTPVRGTDLALQTFHTFGAHLDYRNKIDWLRRHADDSHIRDILVKKQRALEAIIDNPEESSYDRAAAAAQLKFLLGLQKSHAADIADPDDTSAETILTEIRLLHSRLCHAVDVRGNPNETLRAFARHILLYIYIPSVRASLLAGVTLFTYEPPLGITWQMS